MTAGRVPRRHRDHAWWTYVAASAPGWAVAVTGAALLHEFGGVPAVSAILMALAWILLDLAKFPRMRRYYTSEPPEAAMLGRVGVAVSLLAPDGLVRVRGELWQARAVEPHAEIPAGATVRIRAVHELRLTVEPTDPAATS